MPLYRNPKASSADPDEVVLVDASGNVIVYAEGDTPAVIRGIAILADNGGDMYSLQLDGSDNLKVNITAADLPSISIDDGAGSITVDSGAGSLLVVPGPGTWDDATITGAGSAHPANASQVGVSDGTNIQRMKGSTLGEVHVLPQNVLVPEKFDYLDLGYDGSDRLDSVVYKTGGSGGSTVGTLAITYVGSTNRIDTVTKT